jgi:hypothetical protein
MSFNLSAIQMASYGVKSNVASLIITVVFVGLIYALAVRLVILVGYRIARRAYVGKIMPGISETQTMPINYVEFRSIAMGYLIVCGLYICTIKYPDVFISGELDALQYAFGVYRSGGNYRYGVRYDEKLRAKSM